MTFALIVDTLKRSTNGVSVTTDAVDTTDANLIVICQTTGGIQSPTDSKSNTWTLAKDNISSVSPNVRQRIWYCFEPIVGSGHTFTLSAVASAPVIWAGAYSGASINPLTSTNGAASASASSLQTGNVSPSADNALLIALAGDSIATTISVNSSFTMLQQSALVGGQAYALGVAHQIQTAATARNPTFSWASSVRSGAAIAVFNALNPLVGVEGQGHVGSLVASSELPLTGVEGTGDVGSLGIADRTLGLTGVSATGSPGNLTPSHPVALTGVEGTGDVGTLVPTFPTLLTGVEATTELGDLSVENLITIELTGNEAFGAVGNLGAQADENITIALSGVSASGAVGTLGVQGAPIPPAPFDVQILLDGPRYSAIKASATLSVPLPISLLIDPQQRSPIIPAWPTNVLPTLLAIELMCWAIDDGLEISLWWDEGTPTLIGTFVGWDKLKPGQFLQNNAAIPTGKVLISTVGTGSFTLLMRFVKQGPFG